MRKCIELLQNGAKHCHLHPFSKSVIEQFKPSLGHLNPQDDYFPSSAMREAEEKLPLPTEGQSRCAFLRRGRCYVEAHSDAVRRAFDAGINQEPMPEDLMPHNYRLPCEI